MTTIDYQDEENTTLSAEQLTQGRVPRRWDRDYWIRMLSGGFVWNPAGGPMQISSLHREELLVLLREGAAAQAREVELHRLAVEASRTDSTSSAVRHARDELVRVCLSLGGDA